MAMAPQRRLAGSLGGAMGSWRVVGSWVLLLFLAGCSLALTGPVAAAADQPTVLGSLDMAGFVFAALRRRRRQLPTCNYPPAFL